MKRALTVYIVGIIITAAIAGGTSFALHGLKPAWLSSLPLTLLVIAPFALVYVVQSAGGVRGNPFRGLEWGPASWYFLAWLIAILTGVVAIVVTVGLGAAKFDLSMGDYIAFSAQQAKERSGQDLPQQALGMMHIIGYVTAFASPTLGALLGTLFGCLSTFPWLGWFYRRLMPGGKLNALLTVAGITALVSTVSGLASNPMTDELGVPLKMLFAALMSAGLMVISVWLFLRTRSAVVPALLGATYQGVLFAGVVFLSDSNRIIGFPSGAIPAVLPLLAGIALWVWKDPGGKDLAVAAVAADGTPLTPEQAAALQAGPATA